MSERGAIQTFYKIFLYEEIKGVYAYSSKLSDIPCLRVDKVKKQLIGACFHADACENWSERYKVGRMGTLSPAKGTTQPAGAA